jgi:flagellin
MGLQINTNIMAINAQHMLAMNSAKYSKALERLSSGLRINRAADDAAGLAVSEKLKAQVRGTEQASRNAQDGISMIQTGEGALVEVDDMLQRMRELAVEAANGTLGQSDLGQINQELQQLQAEVTAVAQRTQFNGQMLLSGSLVTTQSNTSTVKVGSQYNTTGGNSSIVAVDVSKAMAGTSFTLSSPAAGQLTLTNATTNVSQTITLSNLAANSTGTLDFSQLGVSLQVSTDAGGKSAAGLATDLAGGTVVTAAGTGSAQFQVGANAGDTITVNFTRIDLTGASGNVALDALATALNAFNATQNATNASALITAVDGALNSVNTQRANLGAFQNRLEHNINSLAVADTNLNASESRIADADVAQETTNMVSAQILVQAGESVLSQANQAPQGALSLLPRG